MTSDVPLYERDPEAWQAHLAEGNRVQARKRVGADVLFRDEDGRVLLVDPRYKPDWDLPGGMAEANEPPLDAAKREVMEELGITYPGGRPLVVDWVKPHGPWDDSLIFVFDGGVIPEKDKMRLELRDGELRDLRFCRRTRQVACCGHMYGCVSIEPSPRYANKRLHTSMTAGRPIPSDRHNTAER